MLDHRRGRQTAKGAAEVGWHVFPFLRQALDVRFVDDGVFPADIRPHFAAPPIEILIDHDGFGHAAGVIPPVEREILARATGSIGEMRVAPNQPSGYPLGIRIEHKLVGVEAMTMLGFIWAVNSVAVELTGRDVIQITVPDILVALGQLDALEFAPSLVIEQAKLDFSGIGREQGKVGAPAVPACTEARERSGGQSHALIFRYEKNAG